jgi:hypothetical protein
MAVVMLGSSWGILTRFLEVYRAMAILIRRHRLFVSRISGAHKLFRLCLGRASLRPHHSNGVDPQAHFNARGMSG